MEWNNGINPTTEGQAPPANALEQGLDQPAYLSVGLGNQI